MKRSRIYFIFCCLLLATEIVAQQPELVLPTGNSNQMEAVAVSHNEKIYASADLDGKIKIWEANTGKLLKTLSRSNIYNLAFTPDDKSLVITSFSPPEIYTIGTGKSVILGEQKYCEGLDISPDGKYIAIGGESVIYLWDAKTLQLKEKFSSGASNSGVKFSHDSKAIALFGAMIIELWSVEKPAVRKMMRGHTARVIDVVFSADNKQLLSAGDDKTARLWDLVTAKEPVIFNGHTNTVWSAQFHPDGKKVLTSSGDNTGKLWDISTGKLIQTFQGHQAWVYKLRVSPDGKTFAMSDGSGFCSIWDLMTNKFLFSFRPGRESLYYLHYLKNGRQIVTGNYDPLLSRWNLETQKKEMVYGVHNERLTAISLSNDERFLLTTSRDGVVRKIDATSGKVLFYKQLFKNEWATSADFSPDDRFIVVAGGRASSVLLNAAGGVEETLADRSQSYESFSKFSPDGKYILHDDDFSVELVRIADNKRLMRIDSTSMFTEQCFSADGNYIITGGENKVKVWSVATQQLVRSVDVETRFPKKIGMSTDSKYFFCLYSDQEKVEIWETFTGKLVRTISAINHASFSPDGKNIRIVYMSGRFAVTGITVEDETTTVQLENFTPNVDYYFARNGEVLIAQSASKVIVRELQSGKILKQLTANKLAFADAGRYLYLLNDDMMEVYDMNDFRMAYRHFVIGEDDYLVQDDQGRYDGTEAARKLLYFVCGSEVIELDQAKDQLWIPDLSGRVMKGESINAKTLSELNICGLTPEVENVMDHTGNYSFMIRPRRGGLGETVVYVNGIEAKRYKQAQLKKAGDLFELIVKKAEISNLFVAGKENLVTVKAYTADNAISSRGLIVKEDKSKETAAPPNLYAVMVGVSDYKGDELDLKYAAKDATDISNAVAAAAKKLLNTDGKEHVFMYNLTTAKERYLLPEKNSIKKTMEEIGKKATANDILLVFFAGHGVMSGEAGSKQFYFLTADASTLSTTAAVKDVGISTAELVEWMKPQHIKAQKRILIFDACNSGQAINDIAGKELTVRNDDKAQQIKAIDKLNEKSGLFILSASASDQSAYEMGRYSQGILTYSLLKAIRQQPDILEDGKYLNVSRWFAAAEKTVIDLARENGARQEPQIVTNTNFNIGLVDEEVMATIILPREKPMFAASNFQNSDENVADDDLELSKQINLQLNDIATRGADSRIVYVTATNSPDAYSLSGRYTVKGNTLTVNINIKQNKLIKTKFELAGSKDKLPELAAAIAEKAAGLVK